MNKLFTKIATAFVGMAMAVGVGVAVGVNNAKGVRATDASWDASAQGFSDTQQLGGNTYSFDDSNVTVSFGEASGNGHKYYNNGTAVRSYGGNSFTIACSEGKLTSITLSNNQSKEVTADVGTYSSNSWTGNSSSVTFTVDSGSGNFRTSTISAVYDAGGGGEDDPVLQSIAVSGEKTEYNVGDEFVKPTVTATYDKGDPQDVTESATFTGYNMGVAGNYTVTVSYGGKTTTYDITVTDPAEGDILYSATFTEVETHSYTQNKEFTLNGKDWLASVSQVNGGVFYLGCNSTNASKGVLNDNENFADVVSLLSAEDEPYGNNVSTAHAYAMRFDNAYECVGSVEFTWAGGNNAFQVYIFGDRGDGLENLAHTNYATSGTAVSGSVKWTASGDGEDFSQFVVVARPGATTSTATNKTLRAATFKIVEGEGGSDLQNLYIGRIQDGQDPEYASSYSLPYSTTEDMYSFAAFAGEEIEYRSAISAINWTVSDTSIMSIYQSDGRVRVTTAAKSGTVTLTAKHSASTKLYKDTSVTLSVYKGWVESITVTGSMSKTSYYVGESWDPTGLVVTATYHYTGDEVVTSGIAWSYNPAAPATSVNSVVATATFEGESASSTAQAVTVTRTNPIQVLYTKASGASVDVYGYYVGFLDGTGPVIMDGEYGIVIYNSSADVSEYTEKETILHVTGSISIYKGLYEIGSPTISVASGTFDAPDTPVVYTTAGGETADYASRLTTVTGIPSVTKGNFDDAAGTADITMNFTVGTKTVQVFYKKAAQTADADAFAAIKAAVADSAEITIKGFTGWYNGFQVQMNGYVPPAEGYTAEVFAQDLLDQTDAVCKDYDDVTDNHDAIEAIWSNLASNDKYPSLPSAEKTILAEAARDESGTVVEQAMARYDYLTGKYNLSNFINGRTPVSFEAHITTISSEANTTNAMIIVTVIALTSVSAIAVLLVIKRRKTY